MHRRLILAFLLLLLPVFAAGRRTSFNSGWRFLKADSENAAQPAFDDSSWRKLDLPHDWAIEGPFDVSYSSETGGLPISGVGWYRKHFTGGAAGRHFALEFDGAMSNSTVYVNGKQAGGRPYGYSSFEVDITPFLNPGKDNVVAVRLAPEPESSRWYPGAGIYRNVWMVETGPVHVAHWGTYITTPAVSPEQATVMVRVEVVNPQKTPLTIENEILDAAGRSVAKGAGESASLVVSQPRLWDLNQPYLYSVVTTLRSGSEVLDRYTTPFGIRTIEFTREKGFLLNHRAVKIKGVCNHHDLGALGAAVNARAIERQIEILKEMGMNAIRTSHNPPAPELLDACDRMGILVMDESFDMWKIPKKKNGYSKYFDQWGEADMRDLIRRDRNHPSVFMWSIGNEIPEQSRSNGWEIAKMLTAIAHREDPTRPTTAAFNDWTGAIRNELAANVDVPGFNYQPMSYEKIQREHPAWVIVGSETASCVSSRGVYHLPVEAYARHQSKQVTSYDVVAPPWANCPDVEFDAQDRLPNVVGEFVWTGFDYLGEPTPYGRKDDWPSHSSYFGIVDLAGFPKDRYYLYQSVWSSKPVLHLLPHWNWSGSEGQAIPVMAYTNAEEVELFLNGKSMGRKKLGIDTVVIPVNQKVSPERKFTSKYRLQWDVPYAPGTLRAVGYRGGKQVSSTEVRTAGEPARLTVVPDRKSIQAGGQDLAFLTVRVEDKDGNLCPLADHPVRFTVKGAGKLEAVDNGDATSLESFQATSRKAFNGLVLGIVRAGTVTGTIDITVESDRLRLAKLTLPVTK